MAPDVYSSGLEPFQATEDPSDRPYLLPDNAVSQALGSLPINVAVVDDGDIVPEDSKQNDALYRLPTFWAHHVKRSECQLLPNHR
jgi:hypothetical protein